ncbi:hypothetical protein C1T14_26590, partial [Escherichia coli]
VRPPSLQIEPPRADARHTFGLLEQPLGTLDLDQRLLSLDCEAQPVIADPAGRQNRFHDPRHAFEQRDLVRRWRLRAVISDAQG